MAGDCLVVPHLEKGFSFHPTTEAQVLFRLGHFSTLCAIFDSVPSQNLHQFLHIELCSRLPAALWALHGEVPLFIYSVFLERKEAKGHEMKKGDPNKNVYHCGGLTFSASQVPSRGSLPTHPQGGKLMG